jgi:hypothetical protein
MSTSREYEMRWLLSAEQELVTWYIVMPGNRGRFSVAGSKDATVEPCNDSDFIT